MSPQKPQGAVIGRGGAVLQSGLPGPDPADGLLQIRPALRQVFRRGIRQVLQVVPAGFQGIGDGGKRFQLGGGEAAEGGLHPLRPGLAALLQLLFHLLPELQGFQLRLLPEAAEVVLGKGGVDLRPLCQAAQVLVFLGGPGQQIPQIQGGLDRAHRVHGKGRGEEDGQGVHAQGGHPGQQAGDGGMDKAHQQDGEEAPGDGAGEADVAVEVEFLIGVIPVADLENPLHHVPGDVFQGRGRQHAEEPDQPEVLRHGNGGQQNDDGPGTVNGQQGAVEKAPVHPMPLAEGDIAGLPDPAAEAVEEKQQDPLARGVDVHPFIPPRFAQAVPR